jgi:uncharacterized phage protein gp47/JayE
MAYNIPTLNELYEAHLARLESQIGQDSPLNDKAFLRVLALSEAALDIGHYKFAADAALQNFALTATGAGLDRIGLDNNTPRRQAVTAVLTATLPATAGTVIPAGTEFVSDSTGIRYRTEAAVTAIVPGVATLSLRSSVIGTDGNLDNGETLSISAQIAGADTIAAVTATATLGVNAETDAEYRPRVLFAQRAVTGGANATDHKIWAEAVPGVRMAFPYAGRPTGTSLPGDRTVYVEAVTSVDPDGIAPLPLLAAVRDAINTDPATGESRATLGLTDDTLFVESIIRTSVFIEIRNLDVEPEREADLKADMTTAFQIYFQSITPFVDGVDLVQERRDTISTLSVSEIAQDVIQSYGANAQGIGFGLVVGSFLTLYYLNPGELAKLGGIAYV